MKRKTKKQFLQEMLLINPLIKILGSYRNNAIKTKAKCCICENIWLATPNRLLSGTGCPKCYFKSKEKTHEQFIKEMSIKNKFVNITGVYNGYFNKIDVKCNECSNEWKSTPSSLLSGNKCPKCSLAKRTKTHKQFINELVIINKNIEVIDRYKNAFTKLKVKCLICNNEFKITPHSLLSGNNGCNSCSLLSKGEIKIANYLKSNNISFEPQKTFSECKNIFPLHYDFYLNDFNILIEYDGIQHFIPKEKFGGEKEFIKLQKRDAIKTQFAKVYGIQLIRIPYTELNNVETILTQIVLLHPQSQHHLLLASTSCSL